MVLVNITSYNREQKLINLLNQLDCDTIVWDDCSEFNVPYCYKWDNQKKFFCFEENHGKYLAWKKFKSIFYKLRARNYKYFIFLPDDVVLCDDFVNKAIELWESIEDDKKISLSFSSPERTKHHNWTAYDSHKVGNVIKTQWNDLMFICEKDFLDKVKIQPIDMERWQEDPTISSGVGRQISLQFHREGYSMYNVSEEIVTHIGNNDSKMNPEIREKQHL